MELEKFIAEDMIAFLDRKLHERATKQDKPKAVQKAVVAPEEVGLYSPTKDFEKEMAKAIQDANRAKAQKLLDELKQQHDSFPADAPERLERKRLMEQLYRRFQEAFGHETQGKPSSETKSTAPKPLESLKAPPPSSSGPAATQERFPAHTKAPTQNKPEASIQTKQAPIQAKSRESTQAPPTPQQAPEPVIPAGLSDEEEAALHADLEQIVALIEEESYPAAMRQYHALKERLSEEDMTPNQRETIVSRLRALYTEIAKPLAAKVGGSDEEVKFREHAHAAEARAAAGNLPEAMREFNAAKALCDALADPEKGKETLKGLYERIRAAEPREHHVLDEEEKVLTGSP